MWVVAPSAPSPTPTATIGLANRRPLPGRIDPGQPTFSSASDLATPCERGTDNLWPAGIGVACSHVDPAKDIAEFLTSRRAKVTPEQVGLPTYGPRRVTGLRREEVASLAGVSVDYYRRLERGNVSGVSERVLEALARALQLDDAERAHLHDLAHAANPVAPRRSEAESAARPAGRAADRRRHDHSGNRAQQPRRLPLRERSRPGALRAGLREPRAAREQRPVHVPRPGRAGLLRRLGAHRQGSRRAPSLGGRPQSLRPRPLEPDRRAVDAQPGVPDLVGGAQRPLPPDRQQAPAPPGRR